jgi:hypothetical protein
VLLDRIYSGAERPSAIKIIPIRRGSSGLRSVNNSVAASLVLINNSSRVYSVKWLNFKGQDIDYGTLDRMSYRVMKTYVTHAWELKDMASGRASDFVVDAPFSRWKMDD